jgi:hypothetical protein
MTDFDELCSAIAEQEAIEKQVVKYYVYYESATGNPLYFSSELTNDADYIEITKQQYNELSLLTFTIVNKQIKMRVIKNPITKLVKSDKGIICHVNDVSLIATEGQCWSLKENKDGND